MILGAGTQAYNKIACQQEPICFYSKEMTNNMQWKQQELRRGNKDGNYNNRWFHNAPRSGLMEPHRHSTNYKGHFQISRNINKAATN